MTRPSRNFGFTLVEFMVAITIGLIILAAVTNIFLTSRSTYNVQDRLARLQENGRFAMDFLARDLRMAAYYGCLDDISAVNSTLTSGAGLAFNISSPVDGLDNAAGNWLPSGTSGLPTDIMPGTDALIIRRVDEPSAVAISNTMPNESAVLRVTNITGFNVNDVIVVSDCASADVMQVTQVITGANPALQHNPTGLNATQKLSKSYKPPARVFRFTSQMYYVRNGSPPTLWRTTNGGAGEELVQGVEDLQILYGVDTDTPPDGLPNVYLRAGEAGLTSVDDWSRVKTVRASITARTLDTVDIQRRVFQTTTLLRNM